MKSGNFVIGMGALYVGQKKVNGTRKGKMT